MAFNETDAELMLHRLARRKNIASVNGLVFTVIILTARVGLADEPPVPKKEIDATSLRHKVLCGYQGWFRCPGCRLTCSVAGIFYEEVQFLIFKNLLIPQQICRFRPRLIF